MSIPKDGFWRAVWFFKLALCASAMKRDVKVAGFGAPPFLDLSKNSPSGIDMDILRVVMEKLNYTYTFERTKTWGHATKSGAWDGTMGKIINGSADLGMGHMMLQAERLQVADFGTPLYPIHLAYVSAKPKPLPQYINLTKPFANISWLLCLLALTVTLATHALAHSVFKNSGKSELARTFLITFGLSLHQAPPTVANLKKGRTYEVLFCSFLFFSIFINFAYKSNLRACLISLDYEPLIETSKDVLEQERLLHMPRGSFVESFFKNSPLKYDRQVLQETYKQETFLEAGQDFDVATIRKVTEMGGILVNGEETFPSLAGASRKRFGDIPFRLSDHILRERFCAYTFPKNSALRKDFDRITGRLLDTGIVAKIKATNVPVVIEGETLNTDRIPLNFDHILVGLLMLLLGTFISAIIFFLEIMQHNRTKTDEIIKEAKNENRVGKWGRSDTVEL